MYFTISLSINKQSEPASVKKVIEINLESIWIKPTARRIYKLKKLLQLLDLDPLFIDKLLKYNNSWCVYYVIFTERPTENLTYLGVSKDKHVTLEWKLPQFIDNFGMIMDIFNVNAWEIKEWVIPRRNLLFVSIAKFLLFVSERILKIQLNQFPEIPYCKYTDDAESSESLIYQLYSKNLIHMGTVCIIEFYSSTYLSPTATLLWKNL